MKTEGDTFFASFDGPVDAAAVEAQRRLSRSRSARRSPARNMSSVASTDSAPGIARGLAMASIIQFQHGDPELGRRFAGAAFELVRSMGVMPAPVKVLHLPEPGDRAVERFGAERAAELLAAGAALRRDEVVAEILSAVPPAQPASVQAPPALEG